ncbi:MAG TPA: M14 family metallopeptidase [Phycisphaerales bacterium]|nr:M14 family metallopeptidase [Phycisphaerales bacterium]
MTPALPLLAVLLNAACTLIEPPPGVADDLLTVAERTNYEQTSRHDDVIGLLERLDAISPAARLLSMGTTFEGRTIPMLVIADPPIQTSHDDPESNERILVTDDRIVVLALGNIHAGEVDGKEALPMLARRILLNPSAPEHRLLLDHLVILLVPNYNADGNERMAAGQRGSQNGPDVVGVRENAQGLDLNRDFVKAAAPETRSLLRTINRWDPAVVIDCHITNGSFHRYLVTYAGAKVPAGDARIIDHTRGVLFPGIVADFEARTGYKAFWDGNFNGEWAGEPTPRTRWETFPAQPRYGTNYVGLRNRLSILVETYSYAPFDHRVGATVEFVMSSLTHAARHAADIRELLDRADRDAQSDLRRGEPVAVRSRESPWPGTVTIAGYAEEVTDGRRRPTQAPRDYEVTLWDRFEPTVTVARPWGYAIPPGHGRVLETLAVHGIRFDTSDVALNVQAEVYRVESANPASRAFQGHVLVDVAATARTLPMALPPGWTIVRTAQPLGNLAVLLLEPRSEDGLATWNFFDDQLRAGEDFPVLRLPEPPG